MKTIIAELAEALGATLDEETLAGLATFTELVHDWNARINLTAAREPGALVEVMCADAMMLAAEGVLPEGSWLVDVGSGAGGPALPLGLLRPDLSLTMVEPLRKRVTFLRTAVGTLGLASRVKVLEGRVEPAAPRVEGAPFDVAMSRATFAPAEWLSVGLALAPRVLVLTAQEDPPEPPAGVEVSGGTTYRLPSTGAARAITVYGRLPASG